MIGLGFPLFVVSFIGGLVFPLTTRLGVVLSIVGLYGLLLFIFFLSDISICKMLGVSILGSMFGLGLGFYLEKYEQQLLLVAQKIEKEPLVLVQGDLRECDYDAKYAYVTLRAERIILKEQDIVVEWKHPLVKFRLLKEMFLNGHGGIELMF